MPEMGIAGLKAYRKESSDCVGEVGARSDENACEKGSFTYWQERRRCLELEPWFTMSVIRFKL